MPKYVDYYGQPTESEAVAAEAMRRNERDLARAQAEGKAVGVDYFGQPTTDPRAIERASERNIRDVMREGGGGGKAKVDEDLNAGASAMKRGGKVSSASSRADGIATKGKTRGKIC
jgi:hypothetical protein